MRTYPWVFPVFIERLLTARGQAAFECTIPLPVNCARGSLLLVGLYRSNVRSVRFDQALMDSDSDVPGRRIVGPETVRVA